MLCAIILENNEEIGGEPGGGSEGLKLANKKT